MNSAQQIIGVNERLGNTAVRDMQGTTRAIFDVLTGANTNFTFFSNVQARPFPFSNISQNRFEVGESLAIESIALLLFEDTYPEATGVMYNYLQAGQINPLFNLYIGNQRVIKDLDLSYSISTLGNTKGASAADNGSAVFYLETPIVIPPQIEFYATLQTSSVVGSTGLALIFQGTGTLLNTQQNF